MVLAQVLITNANNGTYFTLPITGKCSMRVLSVQYADKTPVSRVLQVQSDNLYFPYSPQKYLTWISQSPTSAYSTGGLLVDHSCRDYHLKDQTFNGNLLLNVAQLSSSDNSALPNSFQCLLTLDMEQINMEFQ